MNCEVCGKDSNLYIAEIEGTRLNACATCAKLGKILRPLVQAQVDHKMPFRREKPILDDTFEIVVEDYAVLIKSAREKLNLKQADLAKKIAEKESRIHNLESSHAKPSIELAHKLEKTLNIKLIEKIKDPGINEERSLGQSGTMTIGDMLKNKK